MSNGFMDIKEVASYLKIKEQTAYRLVQKGKIPGVKLGGQWKIKKDHLDKMFDEVLNAKLAELKNR
jgi:excisionase family DNA binding protein